MRCLKRFFVGLRQRFLDFFPIKMVVINDDLFPKKIPKRRLILLEDDGPYAVAMLCPCGCGDSIELMVMNGVAPRWTIHADAKNRPTLHPSIWRQSGCGSHFWLKSGRVVWCGPESPVNRF